jgi:hypothetical protein
MKLDEDTAREYRIDQHLLELKYAKTPKHRRVALDKMTAEIRQRSPEQAERMARAKGLL